VLSFPHLPVHIRRVPSEEIIVSFSRLYTVGSTFLLLLFTVAAFTEGRPQDRFDEITVKRINVVDDDGNTRVILAGGFPPRRAALAGLLFINEDGNEAGGLVYRGTRDSLGNIQAGAILTFDQYENDQIVALEYGQSGARKRQGLTIQERPDTLTDRVKDFYRAFETAETAEERDSLRQHVLPQIPRRELSSRRLFAGRSLAGASLVTLADPDGKTRLRLEVDSLGQASITFFDADGQEVRRITP
jgi:hypothetical protein